MIDARAPYRTAPRAAGSELPEPANARKEPRPPVGRDRRSFNSTIIDVERGSDKALSECLPRDRTVPLCPLQGFRVHDLVNLAGLMSEPVYTNARSNGDRTMVMVVWLVRPVVRPNVFDC